MLTFLLALFANEINDLVTRSAWLEDEGLGFAPDSAVFRFRQYRWTKFPRQLKCQYIHWKIKQHPHTPCFFSALVEEILSLQAEEITTKEQKDVLIEKLVDAVACGHYDPREIFDHHLWELHQARYPDRLPIYSRRSEPLGVTLKIFLAVSAILRGNCAELQTLLDQGLAADTRSPSFQLVPLDVAAKKGSKEIIKLLGCPLEYRASFYYTTDALSVAARSGNKEALEIWIPILRKNYHDAPARLSHAMRGAVRIGRMDMVQFIESFCEEELDELRAETFMEAIRAGQVTAVQSYLDQSGFNPNNIRVHTDKKGPLFVALHECPPPRRIQMLKILLERGADANEVSPARTRRPLLRAVKQDDVEAAALLLKHGAEPNAAGARERPLAVAMSRKPPMFRLLLDHGANRIYRRDGKKFMIKDDAKTLGHVEKLLEQLGFDETDIKVDCFAIEVE